MIKDLKDEKDHKVRVSYNLLRHYHTTQNNEHKQKYFLYLSPSGNNNIFMLDISRIQKDIFSIVICFNNRD